MYRLKQWLICIALLVNTLCVGQVGEAEDRPSDQQLQMRIEECLDRDVRTAHSGLKEMLKLRVVAGVVTLSGELPSYSDRMHVQRLCERIEGVASVDNRITILPVVISDVELERAVERRFTADATLRAPGVKIAVEAGVVRLQGEVDSWFDRRKADSLARQVRGVLDVRNEIEVASNRKAAATEHSDLEISQALDTMIHGVGPLSSLDMEYELKDGRVQLQGNVDRFAYRELVYQIVRSITGVVDVDMRQVVVSRSASSDAASASSDELEANSPITMVELAVASVIDPDSEQIKVSENQGEIELSGYVASLARKQQLTLLAKAISRGYDVRNAIAVHPTERDDETITNELRSVIANDARLYSADITVEVSDAHAVLTGKVADFNAKFRLSRLASKIAGLSQLTNHSTVAWSPHISDDGLKKTVERRLQAGGIPQGAVSVREGVITLSGPYSPMEVRQAREIAELTDGVRSVRVATQLADTTQER